jgi:hypothetical protein
MGAARSSQSTQLSEHAYLRVEERLSLEPNELAEQLDYGFAISIKEETHKDIVHRLFYSVDDSQCFVAIQNVTSRLVVTILPVDYYEQRNPRIPPILMEDAKRLVSWSPATGEPQPLENIPAKAATSKVAEQRFEVVVVVNKGSDWTKRIIKLKAWPSLKYDGDAQRLLQDSEFQISVLGRARRVMVPSERVVGLKVRLAKKEPWTTAPFNGQAFELPPAKAKKRR